jgi:mannan endo-1,4-beta-mannosidase
VKIARELGKPIVLEEFGLSRDKGDYDPFSDVSIKNEYY